MTDADRCRLCGRDEYHAPLVDGVCEYCAGDGEADTLIRRILDCDSHFSPQEYEKAVRYLWKKLNPSL